MEAQTIHKPKNFDWRGFFKLVRPLNLLILVLTQYTLKIFLIDENVQFWFNLGDHRLFLLSLMTTLIAAAGYIINDYYDIKIDTVNKPQEVVVGKILKRRVALGSHFGLNIFALFIAAYLGIKVFAIAISSAFLLWFYSNHLKRLPLLGNVTVAYLTAMAVVVIAVYFPHNQPAVYMFAMFAFFISLIREIIKDMEDVRGDAYFGCRTLPIVWGIRKTKQVVYTFFFIFCIIILSTYISFPNQFALYLYLVVLPPLLWFFIRLMRADTRKDFRFLSNLCKAIMVLGILSMMVF